MIGVEFVEEGVHGSDLVGQGGLDPALDVAVDFFEQPLGMVQPLAVVCQLD